MAMLSCLHRYPHLLIIAVAQACGFHWLELNSDDKMLNAVKGAEFCAEQPSVNPSFGEVGFRLMENSDDSNFQKWSEHWKHSCRVLQTRAQIRVDR